MNDTDRGNRMIQDIISEMRKDVGKDKPQRERKKTITEAHYMEAIDIYCAQCRKDEKAIGLKVVQGDKAWYETRCKKGHRCYRNIADKHLDPYYIESPTFLREAKQLTAL